MMIAAAYDRTTSPDQRDRCNNAKSDLFQQQRGFPRLRRLDLD